jgi:SMODS and SLOG-associating 2TM effector domain 3
VKPPTLLRRRPRLLWRAGPEYPLVPHDLRSASPELEPDFVALDRELIPTFFELDREALRAQNSFRRGQVTLILGGLAATTLGAVQAALGGGELWVGLVQAFVAFALSAALVYLELGGAQRDYLLGRVKAERLRSEYFQFLGRLAPYDGVDDEARVERLRRRVHEIEVEAAVA